MRFKRTFNPIHVIAVSIWHRGNNDPVLFFDDSTRSSIAIEAPEDVARHLTGTVTDWAAGTNRGLC